MILARQHIDLNSKCIIEKLLIKTPFKHPAVFQNEACFLYVKDGETAVYSPTETLTIYAEEGVVLQCGNYFADLIQKAPSGICEIYAIHLFPDMLRELYRNEIPTFIKINTNQSVSYKVLQQPGLSHFINSLSFYLEHPKLVTQDILNLKLKELILLLLQTTNAQSIIELITRLFTPRQAIVTEVIQTHLYSNLSLNKLAELSGLSLSTFKRACMQHFNSTPSRYIREQRLMKAAELLCISGFSISEIAYRVGFNDLSHFSRAFSLKYNCSPSVYQQQTRTLPPSA